MDITIPVLILAIPLFMFLLLGLGGEKMSHKLAGVLGTLGMGTVLVLSYYTAFDYYFSGNPLFVDGTDRLQYVAFNTTWLQFTDNLVIKLGFLLDPISAMMLIVIPTISFMVHLYSLGYMHGERGFQRYYAFLSLFSFSMLGLVVATNIFQMYIFWELVGASSDSSTRCLQLSQLRRRRLSLPASPTSSSSSASSSCRTTPAPSISSPSAPTRRQCSPASAALPSWAVRFLPGRSSLSTPAVWASRP